MATHVSLTSISMTWHRASILGALAAALWMSPAAAQAADGTDTGTDPADATRPAQVRSAADEDVDHAGSWPFSGRSMSDREPTWRANYSAAATSGGQASRGRAGSAKSSGSGTRDASARYVAEASAP